MSWHLDEKRWLAALDALRVAAHQRGDVIVESNGNPVVDVTFARPKLPRWVQVKALLNNEDKWCISEDAFLPEPLPRSGDPVEFLQLLDDYLKMLDGAKRLGANFDGG